MQADGNGSGDYMHSGIRGGPHVGAFRRCSFANTESNSKRVSRASPVIHLLVSCQQVLMVTLLPSALQLLPEFFRTAPLTKHIPSQNTQKKGAEFFPRSVSVYSAWSAVDSAKSSCELMPLAIFR